MTQLEELQRRELERKYPVMSEEEKRTEARAVMEKEQWLQRVKTGA